MKGRLRIFEGNWVVDYVVDIENPNAVFTAKTIALHPHDVDKMIDEDQGREVDFDIRICVPSFDPDLVTRETISFTAVEYARIRSTKNREHFLSKETLDELFAANDPEEYIDEDSEDWERASLEDYKDEKDEELLIELEEWDHRCGDGCCYTYGTNIYINGEQIEDEDGTNPHQLLTAVLNKLGYKKISTGDILRVTASADNDLGKKLKLIMSEGKFVPEDIMMSIIEEEINVV
jgi:hypothetical protein